MGSTRRKIARFGLRNGVAFAPGPVFSASDEARGFLRFNAAASLSPRGFEVLEQAMGAAVREPVAP